MLQQQQQHLIFKVITTLLPMFNYQHYLQHTKCINCNCNGLFCPKYVSNNFKLLAEVVCNDDKVPTIGIINIEIDGLQDDERFSYYTVDNENYNLAIGQYPNFKYLPLKSSITNQNCSIDTTLFRYPLNRELHVIAKTHAFFELASVKYNIKMKCTTPPANNYRITIQTTPNPKYYYGTTITLLIDFYNDEYNTIDTLLEGTLTFQFDKTQPSCKGIVKYGRGEITIPLLDFNENEHYIVFNLNPQQYLLHEPFPNIYLPYIPTVKKAYKGDVHLQKNQIITSGKDFDLIIELFDSDNQYTPSIDYFLFDLSTLNDDVYCKLTNYINGYGLVTCNIEKSGVYNLLLKYNNNLLNEINVTVNDNPYQYSFEAILLLQLILIILFIVMFLFIVIALVVVYKKINSQQQQMKNSRNELMIRNVVNREEDAEELDNL